MADILSRPQCVKPLHYACSQSKWNTKWISSAPGVIQFRQWHQVGRILAHHGDEILSSCFNFLLDDSIGLWVGILLIVNLTLEMRKCQRFWNRKYLDQGVWIPSVRIHAGWPIISTNAARYTLFHVLARLWFLFFSSSINVLCNCVGYTATEYNHTPCSLATSINSIY